MIPLASFAGKPIMVPGGTGSIDTLSVTHETEGVRDGLSTMTFKSFEQGSEKMQAESVDWIWVDERCSEEIYSELIAPTTATDGIVFLSYTPLKGGGELTYRFLNEYSADRCDIRIDAQDARHISAARRAELEESYLPHEREARIHGIPQLGIARVFPFSDRKPPARLQSGQGHSELGEMARRYRLRLRASLRCRALRLGAGDR